MHPIRRWLIVLAATCLAVVACKGSGGERAGEEGAMPAAEQVVTLNGAGATFPYPLYSKWMAEYNRLHPNVRINYQSIGSGGGIRQIIAGTVDFGATDAPMTPDEARKAPGKLLHVPTTIGAVAITYNLPDLGATLALEPQVLVDIYLGNVKKWDDPKIEAANPNAKLPARNISVVYRTDGSGTTAVFTDYLASVAPAWKDRVGAAKSVKWPVGLGAKGNEGVTGQVKTTPGAIGYVELAYALQNEMAVASLRNRAGEFVQPEPAAVTKAAKGVELGPDLTASLVDSTSAGAYPIASYTYVLVYQDAQQADEARELAMFLWWAVHDGQKYAEDLHYAPLPAKAVARIEARLKTLQAGGQKLL